MPIEVGFISDLHFGHKAIAKIRGFNDIDEYNEEVIKRWNSVCGKKTVIYLLGDISMEKKEYYPLLERLNGRKILIGGNHELKKDFEELTKYVEVVMGCIEYKGYILTHIPIHPQEVIRFKGNIHGHTHEKLVLKRRYYPTSITVEEIIDEKYYNVCWDRLEGIPQTLEEVTAK